MPPKTGHDCPVKSYEVYASNQAAWALHTETGLLMRALLVIFNVGFVYDFCLVLSKDNLSG